jgi:hypothetical protein
MKIGGEREPRVRSWRLPIAIALLSLCSCSAIAVYVAWDGHETRQMGIDQAWSVVTDPAAPDNRKELALTQIFRLSDEGKHRIEQIAKRDDALGALARMLLAKLKR